MNRRIENNRTAEHAAHLRRLAAGWQAELRQLGRRPHFRRRVPTTTVAPWRHRQQAIAGALALADAIEAEAIQLAAQAVPVADQLPERVTELRTAGLTFAAVAEVVGIPIGTAKTIARRARLQAVTA